ncbi:RimK family alpha-L-glutamate ligase [Bacillus sp. EAC]|uniref:ATP-grasp domain-containing protein n=1 Tax=Bacillus sp. EAC TaxID=1978338 RepID=UPI000B436489|nr:RimK family alpha-L-glutamate ligase [Bacillus sp. EAC]
MTSLNGWIVYNGHVTSSKFMDLFIELQGICANKGLNTKLIKHNELIPVIDKGRAILKGKYEDEKPDFIIYWDKDTALARHLEIMGFKVYNSALAIKNCDNKSLTYQILSEYEIPMPKTINAPLVYPSCKVNDFSFYDTVEQELGYPFVLKESYGSFGMQVYLIHNRDEFLQKVEELQYVPHLYQEFIETSKGRDMRLYIVGDRVVASMIRSSETDFRANAELGGNAASYEPTEAQKDLALRCAKILGVDFAGIDLLFAENDEAIVCEVNSNAHMKAIMKCTGINVAELIIDYIKKDLLRNNTKEHKKSIVRLAINPEK